MFNELVQLYRALDCATPEETTTVLCDAANWVDGLRDRYVTCGSRGWEDGIGSPTRTATGES